MNEKKEKHLPAFVVITSQVHFDGSLSDKDVRIYGYISALANQKGYCYATNRYLAETFSVSEKTIQRAVSSLTKKGYLNPVILRDSEGMVTERRLFLTFPAPQEPHNDGMDKFDPTPMDKSVQYNKINNNNNYGAVNTDTEHSEKSLGESDNKSSTNKPKKTKKDKVKVVGEDSTYYRVIAHFNGKNNTKFKANNKEFVENIDALLVSYTEDEILGVIDYIRECNYNDEFWRPKTIFRPSNFDRSYEFYLKWDNKKAQASVAQAKPTIYYFVNINTGSVIASPIKPTNIPDSKIFSSREEAEATL